MVAKKWLTILAACCLSGAPSILSALESISISFYSEQLQIEYDPAFILEREVPVEEHRMAQYFQHLQETNYQPFLQRLKEIKTRYKLNDWLYFELLQKSIDPFFPDRKTAVAHDLTIWFLLAASGFDVRLAYFGPDVYLYIFTEEELYEVPMIEDGGKTFASLSSLVGKKADNQALYLLNFVPNPKGRAFSFLLRQLPGLRPDIVRKTFQIGYRDSIYQLSFDSDRTIARLMANYPLIAEDQYFKVPFSATAENSLLPELRRILANKTKREALELLVTFTRSSFQYKEDKIHFGFSKPMIAEEVFHHPYSDCEDRSALFYRLVKDLLDLPMIIIAFEDHITIGVALPEIEGQAIPYRGKKYYICDPTGPANSARIGYFPKGYETKSFDVIGSHLE
jgi:hypothetical protein